MRNALLALALAVLATGAACAASPPAVDLSGAWPEAPADYGDAYERWTRKSTMHNGLDHVASVSVTALSPDFRTAYVAERARRTRMPANEREALLAAERAASADVVEFEILIATNRHDWNDLAKGLRSMWRIALVGDDGREVLPTKITSDRRVRAEIATWFDDLGPFYKAYVVTFPRVAADGKPIVTESSTRMSLKIGSAVGATELTWSE